MRIPHHIDGQSFYMIDVPEDESYTRLIKDSRFFELHTSTRKGFRGVRKVGQCRSNFVCNNESCTYLLSAGRKNVHQFNIVGGRRFCFSCNAPRWGSGGCDLPERLATLCHHYYGRVGLRLS